MGPAELVAAYAALARLGYAPRAETAAVLSARAVRLMPLLEPRQLGALAHAAASFARWGGAG
jgi:hypothetical protein